METKQTPKTDQKGAIDKEQQDFFIDVCIRGAADLRKALKITDEEYLRTYHLVTPHPRDFFVFGGINEIEKAGISLMGAKEFLSDGEDQMDDTRMTQNIVSSMLESLMLWERKLTEVLTEMILFSETNSDDYYRHYILVKDLKSLKATVSSELIAYGCVTQNYQSQIDERIEKITALETDGRVDVNKCWWLVQDKKKQTRVTGSKAILSGLDDRINQAFSIATQSQIAALGLSTEEGYGNYSLGAHFNPISTRPSNISLNAVHSAICHTGLLAGHVIAQSRKLLGDERPDGYAAFVAEGMKDGDEIKTLLNDRIKPDINVGDYILAQRDLARVEEVKVGAHGFRSFKLRYLLEEDTEIAGSGDKTTVWTHKNPEFEEYPAMWVRKIYDRQEIVDKVRAEILKVDSNADVSDEKLNPLIDLSVIELWSNVGLKENMHGKRSEAIEKMKKEVERIKNKKTKTKKPIKG
jgi:hypothetical protein